MNLLHYKPKKEPCYDIFQLLIHIFNLFLLTCHLFFVLSFASQTVSCSVSSTAGVATARSAHVTRATNPSCLQKSNNRSGTDH